MTLFADLKKDGLEKNEDRLGGGFQPLETDIYTMTIKGFYVSQSEGGAKAINIIALRPDGKEYRETVYITKKTGENFFISAEKKKVPLPGFTIIDDICLVTDGGDLSTQTFEERTINVYDYDAKKDLPKVVMQAVNIVGKQVDLGIYQIQENKNEKNEQSGEYEPTEKVVTKNVIRKVWHSEAKMTVAEAENGVEEQGVFWKKWQETHKGKVDDSKVVKVGAGGPAKSGPPLAQKADGGEAAPRKSLFGNKK